MHEMFWKAGIPHRGERIQMGTQKYCHFCTNKYLRPQYMIFKKSFHHKEIKQYGNDNS